MSKASKLRRRRNATLKALALVTAAASVTLPAKAAEITREDGVIRITGRIEVGDAGRFGTAAQSAPAGTKVVLHSGGGAAMDGLSIGVQIRKLGFNTVADALCASACALAWAGGVERFVAPKTLVGFHKVYNVMVSGTGKKRKETKVPNAEGNAIVVSYLTGLGYDPRFVAFAIDAEPNELAILTPEMSEVSGAKFL